jgi:5-methylthioadenosine/S-adenosylhomocysteine deaminase
MNAAPQPADILILGADILTFDEADRVIGDGAIAIVGNSIAWIGTRAEAAGRYRAATTIDGSGLIAMPGLIDCHFHTGQQFLRGKLFQLARTRKLRMPPWKNYYVPFESTLTEDDVYYSGLSAYIAMISVGTTCFLESGGPHADAMGRAAEEVGIRGCIALSTMDCDDTLPASMRTTTDAALKANEALVQRWRNHERVKAWLAVRQIIVATEGLQREMAALA